MKTIVCFGDSNTHGTCPMRNLDDMRRFDGQTRWPGEMTAALGAGWQVIEEGHPGRTTVHDDPIEGRHKNGLPALQATLETHRPIDAIIIMLGTNDLKSRFAVQAEDIALAAEKLVATASTSACGRDGNPPAVLLVAPPPILEAGCLAEMFAGGADKSTRFSRHYAACADRQDCAFLDAGAIVDSCELDGVHLEGQAHQALGQAIADKVGEMMM